MRDQIAVVHNGTITNYRDLKNELIAKGVTFRSQTDTEVIAQLIGALIAETGCDVVEAVKKTCARLEGTWGICVLHRDKPEQIVVARNGSPLVVGYGDDRTFIASETTAFNRHTKKFVSLKDGEIAVVRTGGVDEFVEDESHGSSLQRFPTVRVELAPEQKVELSPAPYAHWTIREIMEQPKAIAASLGYGGRVSEDKVFLGGLEMKEEELIKIQNLIIAACGTSLNAGNYGAKLMRSLGSFSTIQTVDAAECQAPSFPKKEGGILVVSQSGETKDVHRSLVLAMQEADLPAFSVVNAVGSLIARTTKCGVYCHAGRENAVASTKAFVTQVTVMGLIAAWFAQHRADSNKSKMIELIECLHRLPITAGATLRCREQCKKIAAKLMRSEHMFVLGKGYAEPVAAEGALKIKEITYLHAEGYSGGALKHGPFALIESEEIGNSGGRKFGATPIILFILDDEHCSHMRTCAEEVRARGAYTIVVTDCPEICKDVADDLIVIPNNGPMTALLGCIPLQMIAYELAVMRGINPDVPRNLAKAVTVD
jgi:glucosamine--fructose-6-phosphate aminotransferase (isomerizing)